MANLLKKHRQLRGTAASTYRKALFSIFGEKELPYIQSTDDHNVIATWKASPQEQIKKSESLHREVNHSTESENEDDEDEEAFINEEE
ncbi:hypothetical protein Glove_23g139 [Diversispora epigaea]|uniref:Uncharacterized protein n=1 Tax=Diversispora epigaea TaxID=1348612 RepID=A0A397JKD8_9GLOM|nr:hypothetical protein Glove_23g139 [Diversispora epigaea]